MHESKVKAWMVALIAALLPCVAGAAGLGRITVLTAIGQALVAEFDLSVTKEELGSLDARLALPAAYQRANLQYNIALTGARLTIEKRPNGQPYLKLVTTRPVVEPFIDVLVELTWASGRLSREYTALLDPPGIPPAPPPAPVVSAVPKPVPAPAPQAPVTAEPPPAIAPEPQRPAAVEPQPPVAAEPQPPAAPESVAAAPAISTPIAAAPLTAAGEYGPIERGETLGKIARSVKPEGVTLEQMLVALYRSNPEAFIRKNLNLVRAGKILRVPERDEVTAIPQGDAVTEYRTHVADWNAYRQRLADAAGTVTVESHSAVSGKIATKVEDKTAGGPPKDVVKLSKGEPAGGAAAGKGKPRGTAERIRMLEEEVVARERALAEANERITQLEKTIKDMQKLVELKSPGMAAAQQQAKQAIAPKPEAKPGPKPAPAKPEAKKPEAVAAAKPAAAPTETPTVASLEPKKPEPAAAPVPKPATQAKAKAPPPPPEPGLVDQIMEAAADPLYLGAGGGVIVLGGLALWMARRRRARAEEGDSPPIAPTLSTAAAAAAGAAATNGDTAAAPTAGATSATPGDDVDPIAEADVYILYGRDGQAEEILKEALARDPRRADVQLKLLEVYATRQDKTAFGRLAGEFNKLTGGTGDNWRRAAEMGYALDPANRLYEGGRGAAATLATGPGDAADVDLHLGSGPVTSTDIALDAGTAVTGTDSDILDLGAADAAEKAAAPDFTLEVPPAGRQTQADVALDAAPAQDSNVIDFQIDLPKLDTEPATIAKSADSRAGAGLDFKLEVPDLDLGEKTRAAAPAGGEKDGHWYDVQTKFDLAKAYQEMGDKSGAKEILQEVIQEGDAEQKEKARTLLDSLG